MQGGKSNTLKKLLYHWVLVPRIGQNRQNRAESNRIIRIGQIRQYRRESERIAESEGNAKCRTRIS